MLEDLRDLIEFAHTGSISGAVDRLFRTFSANRQMKGRETALGVELLDRSGESPRLNSLGSSMQQARDLLQRTDALKSLRSSDAEPRGLLLRERQQTLTHVALSGL